MFCTFAVLNLHHFDSFALKRRGAAVYQLSGDVCVMRDVCCCVCRVFLFCRLQKVLMEIVFCGNSLGLIMGDMCLGRY